MDKKIILGLIILIFVSGLVYGAYALLGINDNHNNTTNNSTIQNNTTKTVNNSTNDKKVNSSSSKKSTNKYWCDQCQEYHPSPVQTYHRYGNCPICGKWVDTQTTSHTHDRSPGYKEEPIDDNYYDNYE